MEGKRSPHLSSLSASPAYRYALMFVVYYVIVANAALGAAFSTPPSTSKVPIQPFLQDKSCAQFKLQRYRYKRRQIVSLNNSLGSSGINPDDNDSLVDKVATKITDQFVEDDKDLANTSITGNSKSDRFK